MTLAWLGTVGVSALCGLVVVVVGAMNGRPIRGLLSAAMIGVAGVLGGLLGASALGLIGGAAAVFVLLAMTAISVSAMSKPKSASQRMKVRKAARRLRDN